MFEHLFTPQKVAVVGATNKRDKMGNLFIRNLRSGFPGKIYPVHPRLREIDGLEAYSDLSAIPGTIDLLVPLIPASEVVDLVRDCPAGKVKVLLAIPSGFGEVPNAGKELQDELNFLCAKRRIRVVGPNSVGLFNCPYGLNASMVPELPPGGPGFSCVTQSGGFGMAVYMYTTDNELEMAKFCDLGNSSDVAPKEVLEYLGQDDETAIVGAFLEAYLDPNAFLQCALRVAKEKPVILTKLGRTSAGAHASFAHIGLSSGNLHPASYEAPVITAGTSLEMMDIAKGLSWQSLPEGRRVGIVTGSGGIGAELADLCLDHSLEVPIFSPQLQERLRPLLPPYASVRNPVDLTPIWYEYAHLYPPILEILNASEEVDILMVTIIDVATSLEPLMHAVAQMVEDLRLKGNQLKPLYINWSAPVGLRGNRQILQRTRIPCFESTLSTVRTAAAISDYARLLNEMES